MKKFLIEVTEKRVSRWIIEAKDSAHAVSNYTEFGKKEYVEEYDIKGEVEVIREVEE